MTTTMEKVLNLYNRPGTDGEKMAAREALLRMGLDACYFADYPERVERKKQGGGRRRFRDDQIVTVLVASNPKRKGTAGWQRFEMYESGMTVAQALQKGLWLADLCWDADRGFVSIQ